MWLLLVGCSPPTVVERVQVAPSRPTTSQDVRCEVQPAVPPGTRFDWFVDGAQIDWVESSLPAYWFQRGQSLSCSVAEHPLRSSPVQVLGVPPSLDAVRLEVQVEEGGGHRVRAQAMGWFDADGDPPELRYRWLLEGQPLPGTDTVQVPPPPSPPEVDDEPSPPVGSRLMVEVEPVSPDGPGAIVRTEVVLAQRSLRGPEAPISDTPSP